MKPVRIRAKDIALECGVSQATVSYVINQKEGINISDDVRKLVLETAERLHYYPNRTAQNMRLSRSMSIGIVTGQNAVNFTFNGILKGIRQTTDHLGYSITLLSDHVYDGDDHKKLSATFVQYLRSRTVDGLIFIFRKPEDIVIQEMEQSSIPYVWVEETGIKGEGLEIQSNLEMVIHQCVLLCKQQNFKNIACFLCAKESPNPVIPYKSYIIQSKIAELYPEANYRIQFFPHSLDEDSLLDSFQQSLYNTDIIFSLAPRIAFLTQSAIMRSELCIPPKVSHISLCDFNMFDRAFPSISHIKIPLESMGKYAADYLISRIEKKPLEKTSFSCTFKPGSSLALKQ